MSDHPDPAALPLRGPRWFQWTTSRVRVGVMFAVGVVVFAAVGLLGQWAYAPVAGWDAATAVFLAWVWSGVIITMTSTQTASHATRENPGTAATDVIVLLASVASLAAVAAILVQASSSSATSKDVVSGVGVLSVALSWFTVHTLYTLKYARLYYGQPRGGIDFNQKAPPRYLDFAYVAFSIGMTFQVSDTDLESPTIRATALRQALLAYLFGAVILATTINLIAGLRTSG